MHTPRFLAVSAMSVAAIAAFVAAQPHAQAPAAGAVPTFSQDVAPILYKHCTNCHRPGEIAPMSLLTYAEARPWARSIGSQVSRGAMPPWHADPAHGEFLNDRRLSAADKSTIIAWANGGAPEGDPAAAPAAPAYESGWNIGRPDEVFEMQEDYPVPAEGTIAYKYFEIPTRLTEDKWVQSIEVKAGNPAVVHHVIVYARTPRTAPPAAVAAPAGAQPSAQPAARRVPLFTFPEGSIEVPAGQTGGPDLPPEQRVANDRPAPQRLGSTIGGFAPGQTLRVYQPGTAMRLAAGSTLIFQMHYTASGKATTDRTRIAVTYAKEKPTTEVRFVALVKGTLHIPAGAANYKVEQEMTINRDVTLWSMLPHTHLRGKRWEYEAIYPDGRTETILSVPKYDFNWQTDYVFKQPLKLPKGTRIHAAAWYDNSSNNPSNPDSTKDVWWGDQTWEEMMFTGLTYSADAAPPTATAPAPKR
ncbi:MAG TPA: hypothetical protein VHU82_15050 [Vicinamibacterales bacterium]|jgi:hypothetical protein|nr:hypothetical protein [Vicinamibacterales bacterium]